MIYKEHYIELFINGQHVELESQKSLNLRFQNVLFDPTKISSTNAEYSFEFEVPSTPNNDRIFNYANNLSKLDKFHSRWSAEVYADGDKIFEGSLTLNSYKSKMYKCNLVSVKNYSLDEIFGDSVLYDISGTRTDPKWYIDFDGASTINAMNASGDSSVMFPLVSYGVFEKDPDPNASYTVGNSYTSKFQLDKYNRWWMESFYPSLSMVETMRKCFEYKGYTVGGDLFKDDFLKDVYMSVNLADGQSPDYNLGNPKFGKIDLSVSWQNPLDIPSSGLFDTGTTFGTEQELKFPYFKSGSMYWDYSSGEAVQHDPDYNFKEIKVYNMMSTADGGSVTLNQQASYIFEPNNNAIVIPADGFYRITLDYSSTLDTTSALTASQWVHEWLDSVTAMSMSVEEQDITFNPDFRITTPLEIQLVRNYDENIELIKGKNNMQIHDGFPDNTTECNKGRYSNYSNVVGCFPHEATNGYDVITKWNDLSVKYSNMYVPADNTLMCYDPAVSDIFIAGATSMGNKNGAGTGAVIKNGYSWSKSYAEPEHNFYVQNGYYQMTFDMSTGYYTSAQTTFNKNDYNGAPQSYHNQTARGMNGRVVCLVELKKNDVLRLFGVHRGYQTMAGASVTYQTSANVNLVVEAISPNSYADLVRRNYGYNSPIEFDTQLRLSNFLSNEKKISEWVQNIADAFNLEIIQEGKNVTINTKSKEQKYQNYAVDIDNRVNSNEAESSMIEYPRSMSVRYKIDTDEWGAEKSVLEQPDGEAKMNEADWKKYIDSGFTNVMLNDDSYITSTSDKSLQFSYTWYDNFYWHEIDYNGQQNPYSEIALRLPVISKFTYMIDGYDYEESMKHDGYGLSQRFWFKPTAVMYYNGEDNVNTYEWTETYPKEKINIYVPSNAKNGLNLSYKTTENSLLTRYFNIVAYLSSNYVEVEVYLSPEEYTRIKSGAMVHFDSDLYIPVEIGGYDPSGYNPTTLKMMKKVV